MSLEWEQTIVDAGDPGALGRWWREALGWVVVNDEPGEFEIRPTADRLPGLLFVSVSEPKTTKNRLHLDFRPDDRDAEVERLLALGATRADVGQGEQTWMTALLRTPTASADRTPAYAMDRRRTRVRGAGLVCWRAGFTSLLGRRSLGERFR